MLILEVNELTKIYKRRMFEPIIAALRTGILGQY